MDCAIRFHIGMINTNGSRMTNTNRIQIRTGIVFLLLSMSTLAADPQPAKPAAKGRTLNARYPLPYPPRLAEGKAFVTEESPDFLKPGPNLRPGVVVAKTPPKVDFSYYPEQNYPGNPWSHRSDGIVVGDKYYTSSNDHLAPRGTAHLWEYDAPSKQYRLLCDTAKFLESVDAFPATMNYRPGEMQSRIDLGRDGWLYYATDRGSPTVTNDAHGWLGEWILRTHPQTLKTEIVYTHPIPKHTIPASVLDPQRMILYCGTAAGKDAVNQSIQFFALDVVNKKILKVADDGPTRTLIFSKSTGRVFWEGKMYDPRTNEITASNVPHVRSCTAETPQGLVYGTSLTKAELWVLDVNSGEVKQLGNCGVAKQEYIASIEADPTGRYLYYVPGAHGGAAGDGTPIVQYDTRTGTKKVLAFLHDVFWDKHGYALDGSFGNALDEKGERFFISWDGWRKGQPRGWESAAITVVHIPASERATDAPAATGCEPEEEPRHVLLDAATLYRRSVTRDVQLATDGKAIVLQSGELIEDDGPAAGFSYQPNEEQLSAQVWIKKELIVERPDAKQSTLLVGRAVEKNAKPLEAIINGQPAALESIGRQGRYWEAYRFDAKFLRAGKNEFVLHGAGKVWIARDDEYAAGSTERTSHPNRSAKSTDAGKTWQYDNLGAKGNIDGEYYVRLFLDRNRPLGSLTLPVVDACNLAGKTIAPSVSTVGPVTIKIDGTKHGVAIRARTGTTYTPHNDAWSPWQTLAAGGGTIQSPAGRYVQVALDLSSTAALPCPEVNAVSIQSAAQPASDWTAGLKVVEQQNAEIVRTSIPFRYEPYQHPSLQSLRRQHKLDELVSGAADEMELITRLAKWSSGLWQKGHLGEAYPAWDAAAILAPHRDGQPVGGFCQQYNLVFLQACQSFGLPGRAVSISQAANGDGVPGSGHEVVEIWSNQHQKWIYVDGNCAWYAIDSEHGVPLSLWELRERQLQTLAGQPARPIRVNTLAETRYTWEGLAGWPPFAELRMIPRSNFLEQRSPLPLNQGMRGWFWTGHQVWDDALSPAALLYGQRVIKRGDFEWTLNQAHFELEATTTPGELRVHLDTETPNFDTFLARLDEAAEQSVQSSFIWKLHAGRNRLEVAPRNNAGRKGIASWIVLDRE